MLEDTNSLDGAQASKVMEVLWQGTYYTHLYNMHLVTINEACTKTKFS